jgi:hypothetical protein
VVGEEGVEPSWVAPADFKNTASSPENIIKLHKAFC